MMTKKLFFILLLILFALSTKAQFRFTINTSAALPTGYLEDAVSLGYGGNLNFGYQFLFPNFELSFTSGYYHFGFKENLPDYDFSFSSIPVLVGFKIYLGDYDFIPYIGFESGVYLTKYLTEVDYGFFGKSSVITRATHFGISPELGLKLLLHPNFDVDINTKYNRINTDYIARAYLLIQTGFSFKL
jgi:hypothetical protein